jgi:glycosyltransferase involved in cell wall biosynthesis
VALPSAPHALADVILSLMSDPSTAARLGEANRCLARNAYTIERMVEGMASAIVASTRRTSRE